ncbi:MAG TPA: DUF4147 domain-containing protein [Gemmatimonadaceae bacterium]|nr:DUF4147 domain-containing protein [Gemmatimonadaceae bacterium]
MRALLLDLYRAAVDAASPARALTRALEPLSHDPGARVWILALGKAAHQMARTAVEHLAHSGSAPAGGLIVAHHAEPSPHAALDVVTGDHPLPGDASRAAAARLGQVASRIEEHDDAWVLLSGGASSLLGAPADAQISDADFRDLSRLLYESGLDIATMNLVRRRFARWGGGRLAIALARARCVRVLIISDVVGDDIAVIGSGPCAPDPATAADVHHALVAHELWERVPQSARDVLARAERDARMETPKPGDPAFRHVKTTIVAGNHTALEGAAERARAMGADVVLHSEPVVGDAAHAGATLATVLRADATQSHAAAHGAWWRCLLWGGETTVDLRGISAPRGGRCQELALAAARVLSGLGPSVALLAAGTDGRDGPTDAAGATVDGESWERLRAAGRDPEDDLAQHRSYDALDAAGMLLKTGPTDTNVMDVMIALCPTSRPDVEHAGPARG